MSIISDIISDMPPSSKPIIKAMRNTMNIVGLSGGKDSLATCILMRALDIPFQTLTAEVWWKEGITGENPLHYDFFHEKAIPKLESWGVKCNLTRSKITAYEYMTTPIIKSTKHPERIGKLRGFPLCNKCGVQRDCKTRPCERFYKENGNLVATVGIASDEKDRLITNASNNRISLLELLRVPEYMTFPICANEGLISPTYSFSERGGCWFCPNQKIQELEILYRVFPHLWNELMEIQKMPNKLQEKFNRTQTLYDIESQILHGVQIRANTGIFYGGQQI